ncbi:MAG TPA: AAA family ATPase [Chitinophagaceae bacterium]|nr:AAA family ATPase [Chitinophagaceae bacterium]
MDKDKNVFQIKRVDNEIKKLSGADSVIGKISTQSLSDYDEFLVTAEKDIPRPAPQITVGGAPFAAKGNISGIVAPPKGAKTAIGNVIAAAGLSDNGTVEDFPEICGDPNYGHKAVIAIDSEQGEADQQDNIRAMLRRARIAATPDYYRAYNIRKLKLDDYEKITKTICELCAEKFGGIHMILIDGGADFIPSVNDEEAANRIIQFFVHLAIQYDCAVIIIIHQNPGSEKERGHLGSEFQRKSYGTLAIKREGDLFTLESKRMRKAGNGDVPIINFKYSKEKGYHVQVGGQDNEKVKAEKEMRRIGGIAVDAFSAVGSWNHDLAVSVLMKNTSKGETTCKTMLKNMLGWGFMAKDDNGIYRRVNEGQRGSTGFN